MRMTVRFIFRLTLFHQLLVGGGGTGGAGARENRGRKGYRRRERKGREVVVLRGREAGEKCETLFF